MSQQTRVRQPVGRARNLPAAQKRIPARISRNNGSRENERRRGGVGRLRPTSPTESEDEAYGGSPNSEDDELKLIADTEDSDNRETTADESEDQDTPRRILPPREVRARQVGAGQQPTPRGAGANGKTPRRVINGKGPERGRVRNSNHTGADDHLDTFGDDERKCVKEFKEAFNSFNKSVETNEMPLEEEIQHLLALAEVYKKSATGTLNIYSLLRTSGLYNICLRKCENLRPNLYADIKEMLIQFEDTAMRRVLKIKSTHCQFFAHEKKRVAHLKELKEIRDICAADFQNITEGLREFPSAEALLKLKTPSTRQIAAEDNIIASTSLMFGEVTERIRGLVAGIIAECLEIQGPPPCNYAVVGNHKFGGRNLSPFDPISLFLVIENATAGTKAYFRNTLALLGMKISNFGETSLLSLNIRSLAWFTNQAKPSGFSLANYIDDNEKKEFSTVPLDCISTPKELTKLAVSDKREIRLSIINLLQNTTFITGDLKMFKELGTVRSAVIQREQAEKSYKKSLFARFQKLVASTDPLSRFALEEGNEDEIQSNVMSLTSEFMTQYYEMDRSFLSEGTINKLEEMMSTGASISYSSVTITTDIRQKKRVVSTISTRLETPTNPSPSPEPVRLPDIPMVIKKKDTWTVIEERSEDKSSKSPPPDQGEALRKLKEKKASLRTEYQKSVFYHVPRGASVGRSTNGGAVSDISSSTGSSGPSNTWRKSKPPKKPKPKTPPNQPTPEPIERFVYIVPAFDGRQKNILSADSSRSLVLLHSLAMAVILSNRSATCVMSTKHDKSFNISSKHYEAAYIKILQVVVPFINSLKELVFTSDTTAGNLKKGLRAMDLNSEDDEFVVAVTHFQNRKYPHCCRAIYRYLENRSDITFVGEPFPIDFTEVCQELLEDDVLTIERYTGIHLLMAHSQMRRGSYDEALSHWSELLSHVKRVKAKANIYENIAECCLKLGRTNDAMKSINKAISLYKEAQSAGKEVDYEEELAKLFKMKSGIKG